MSQTYVREANGLILLGNGRAQLGLARDQNGALTSILDRQSGCELIRDPSVGRALFRLALRRTDDQQVEWIESSEAERLEWATEQDSEGAALALTASHFPGRDIQVVVKIRLDNDSSLSAWRSEVRNVAAATVHQFVCPIVSGVVKIGDSPPGEAIAFPRQGEGYLYTDPYPVRDRLPLCAGPGPESPDVGVGCLHGRYPGNIPLQFFCYYHRKAGLYLATHDAGQNVKSFDIAPNADWGEAPVLSVSHFPSEDGAIDYDTVLGLFHGDWYDAADIYKAWATQQWWCEKKLWDRDIGGWMRKGFGVFQMSNYGIPRLDVNHSMAEIADTVNRLSAEIGVPLLALVFNWEGGGAWTGPKGFFPPGQGEAEFRAAMAELRDAGNYGFVYITGGCWYLKLPYDPPFDSWPEFENEGRPHAIRDVNGEVAIGRWYPGWESTRICAQTDYTQELTTSVLLECLDRGCSIVQIDNFPCGGGEACHDPSHGHPLGYGPWWSAAWGRLLAEARRQAKAKDPDCAITTEGIAENFIPWLDLYDHRSGNMEYFGHYSPGMPMGGETIPLFNYVYNEYIGSYCAAMPECNRPEVLYWTRCFGKALTQGVVPTGGWYFPDPRELNPVTIGFYKKIVRATAQECWPYLMFGEMLRPPEIDVPTITASYCKFVLTEEAHYVDPKQRHEVQDRAVQHAAFRGRDGTIGCFFVNVSEAPVSFEVELSAYRAGPQAGAVERFTDGTRESWLDRVSLPREVQMDMEPLSITVLVVRCLDDEP